MENLKRYGPCLSKSGFATMQKIDNGGWVKFSNIKEFAMRCITEIIVQKDRQYSEDAFVSLSKKEWQTLKAAAKLSMACRMYRKCRSESKRKGCYGAPICYHN